MMDRIDVRLWVAKKLIEKASKCVVAICMVIAATCALIVHAGAQDPQLTYSPWAKACEANDRRICATSKEGRTNDGKVVVAAELIEQPGQKTILRIALPLGMSIQPGTRVIVDQGQPLNGDYVICSQNGCMADYEASGELVEKLKYGQGLVVQGINGAGQPISLVLPLNDFAKAYSGSTSATRQANSAPNISISGQEQLAYSPWTKFCLKGQEANAKQVCFTGKDARLESGTPVAAAVLIEPEGETRKVLRVTLPLGMSIQSRTRVILDQGQALMSPYLICFENGCMADYEASNELINRLKRGRSLWVEGVSAGGNPIKVSLPLVDFARAYDGPPTDPKVFEAQQKKLQEDLQKRADDAKKRAEASQTAALNQSANRPAATSTTAVPEHSIAPNIPSAVPGAKRVALVIGNDRYAALPQLRNAAADARLVAETLRKELQFQVFAGENLGFRATNRLQADFEAAIGPGDTVFVFFAGHGVAFGAENYLLPIDIEKPRVGEENLIRSESHAVDNLIRRVQAKGALASFFVVDACRDNPFASVGVRSIGNSRGLARADVPTGVFVLFSAGIGQTALDKLNASDTSSNSVFTRTLVPLLRQPGLSHLALAKRVQTEVRALAASVSHQQQPAFYDQIEGEVMFKAMTTPQAAR